MKIDLDGPPQPLPTLDGQKQAKLVDAAQQFEATMLQELLKPMQHAQGSWDDEDKNGDNTFDTITGFGTETMAKAISKAGGFGIARQVISQITSERDRKSEKKTSGY